MRELGLLLKNQFITALKSTGKRQKKNSRLSGAVLMAIVIVIMASLVSSFSASLAFALKPAGMLWLLPALMMAAASVISLITSVYKVNGLLFGFKDYDLLMSLPIPARTVVTSRLLMLYAYNMIYVLLIMAPSAVVYCMAQNPPAAFYPVFIICLLCVPMVPVIIATAIGTLIAYIASFFKRKSAANLVFTIIFMLLWCAFCFSMNNIVEGIAQVGTQIADVIYRIYPFAKWYTQAVCDLNISSLALFVAVSVACWTVFCVLIGKKFKYLNAKITSDRTKTTFKMKELKTESPDRALFRRELKRFTSSSEYMLNSAISPIMAVIFSAIICIAGDSGISAFFDGAQGDEFAMLIIWEIPFVISMFTGMTLTSACSISLEGNKLWIIKSLPVTTAQILKAKLKLNLAIGVSASIICAVLLTIGVKPPAYAIPAYFLLPISYCVFSTVFGLKLNLAYPNFKWESEIMVVKRSASVLIATFVDMGLGIAGIVCSLILGGVFAYSVIVALLVISFILYRNIMTKGVKKFEALEG